MLAGLALAIALAASLNSEVERKRAKNEEYRRQRAETEESAAVSAPEPVKRPVRARGVTVAGAFDEWSVDPFDRAFTREPATGDGVADGDRRTAPIQLWGVMVTERGAAALINDRMCLTGEAVDQYIVEAILEHGVVLRNAIDGSLLRLEVK